MIKTTVLLVFRWDPVKRLTPEEACQHDWIKEGMVHRSRNLGRSNRDRKHISADVMPQQDPYKNAASSYLKGTFFTQLFHRSIIYGINGLNGLMV